MITEIQSKSILRKNKKIDSWFITHYGINLYRGCMHNCVYCDGRAESYRVEGDFSKDITIKTNAIELLDKELDPARKRKPMPHSYMMLGGGVSDSYQPVENKYMLARQTLELIYKYKYPVHILTKSTLVERDIDIIKKINQQSKAIVSFSFSGVNDEISSIFEPGVPSPSKRLETISKLKREGISCGMFLMPVLPFITDYPKRIEETLIKGKRAGIDFVIFGGLTLKEGRQKDYFMDIIKKHAPDMITEYEILYQNSSKFGEANSDYYASVNQVFDKIASALKIPKRIPLQFYRRFLNTNDLAVVILEHIDYILKLRGQQSPFGYAAYSISQLEQSIRNLGYHQLTKIKGVGPTTAKIVDEIIKTGSSSYYERLM